MSDDKYAFKTFYSYNFNNNDSFQLEFTEKQFDDLKTFLNTNYKLKITDTYTNIIQQINSNSNLLYNYVPYETILDYFTKIHRNDKTTTLNNSRKEHYYTKLLSILLYDLDNSKFYNKRWLLNYYESCLLNQKFLILIYNLKLNTINAKKNVVILHHYLIKVYLVSVKHKIKEKLLI